jgi:hypothetical protein
VGALAVQLTPEELQELADALPPHKVRKVWHVRKTLLHCMTARMDAAGLGML